MDLDRGRDVRPAHCDDVGPRLDGGVRQRAEVRHRMRRIAIALVRVDREHRSVRLLASLAHGADRRGDILFDGLIGDAHLLALEEPRAEQPEIGLAQHPFPRGVAHPVVEARGARRAHRAAP